MDLLFKLPDQVTPENLETALHQAISLELATIPTYLSIYYSIKRTQDQDALLQKIKGMLPENYDEQVAQDLTLDVLVYSNQAAALVMSVVIEEMLHLSLSSNVRQAICSPPQLMDIARGLTFPTMLDGHKPEFPINLGKLNVANMVTLLKIESPNRFFQGSKETDKEVVTYTTIGKFYDMIIQCVQDYFPGPYDHGRPQLYQAPDPQNLAGGKHNYFYSQNSINTVYYDRQHNPHFQSADDSGGLMEVRDAASAVAAMNEIIEQGEGHGGVNTDKLEFGQDGLPKPLPIEDGKVVFKPGDFDDPAKEELSHFGKFMEVYTLGRNFEDKFRNHGIDFWSLFVHNQADNAKVADYPAGSELYYIAQLGNALYTYIILMVETCYYKKESTQFEVFMYGVHKSMIWLLSQFGRDASGHTYTKDGKTYQGAVTFEYYPFENNAAVRPKDQIYQLCGSLIALDPGYSWLLKDTQYVPSLPDVGLDHSIVGNPAGPVDAYVI